VLRNKNKRERKKYVLLFRNETNETLGGLVKNKNSCLKLFWALIIFG
jgi:hypothetical protein